MRLLCGLVLGLLVGILSTYISWWLTTSIFFVLALVVLARVLDSDRQP